MIHNDIYGIVPQGAQAAKVTPFNFQVRTLVEYDTRFLQDRVVSQIFVNGKPCGVYATVRTDEDLSKYGPIGSQRLIEQHGPELERAVIDEFMGLGYRDRVVELERDVRALRARLDRVRWWHIRKIYWGWKMSRFVL